MTVAQLLDMGVYALAAGGVTFGIMRGVRAGVNEIKRRLARRDEARLKALQDTQALPLLVNSHATRISQLGTDSRQTGERINKLIVEVKELQAALNSKADEKDDDESFVEKAELSNSVNRIATHAAKKTMEEGLNKQVPELVKIEVDKLTGLMAATISANLESKYQLKKRKRPVPVRLDMKQINTELDEALDGLVAEVTAGKDK